MSFVYRELSSKNKSLFNKCVDYYKDLRFVEDAVRDKSDKKAKQILRNLINEYKIREEDARWHLMHDLV